MISYSPVLDRFQQQLNFDGNNFKIFELTGKSYEQLRNAMYSVYIGTNNNKHNINDYFNALNALSNAGPIDDTMTVCYCPLGYSLGRFDKTIPRPNGWTMLSQDTTIYISDFLLVFCDTDDDTESPVTLMHSPITKGCANYLDSVLVVVSASKYNFDFADAGEAHIHLKNDLLDDLLQSVPNDKHHMVKDLMNLMKTSSNSIYHFANGHNLPEEISFHENHVCIIGSHHICYLTPSKEDLQNFITDYNSYPIPSQGTWFQDITDLLEDSFRIIYECFASIVSGLYQMISSVCSAIHPIITAPLSFSRWIFGTSSQKNNSSDSLIG
jgi:hypothetical protein